MTLAQTYSWLFYALALASQTQSAKYRDIEQAADCINHAIPTQKEIRDSLSWLISKELIRKDNKAYCLTDNGSALLNELSAGIGTTMGVWKGIEAYFAKKGVDSVLNINPNTLKT